MRLVITEKPSVAQSLAKVIGVRERKAGYLEVFIVKFKYRKVQNKNVGNCTYKM